MPTLEGAFRLRDQASAQLRSMRLEAQRTDTAFEKLGLTMDGVSSSRRSQGLQSTARAARQLGTEVDNAARRTRGFDVATRNADKSSQGWLMRLQLMSRGAASFAKELMPLAKPAGLLYGFGSLAGLAGQGIAQLGAGVIALTPRLLDMTNVLAAAVPAYVGFAGALATFKVVSKDISTAMQGGKAGAAALRDMGTAGANVVRQLRAMRFEMRNLEQSATRPVYQALSRSMPAIRGAINGPGRTIASSIGQGAGSVVSQAVGMLTGGGTMRDLTSLAGTGGQVFSTLGGAAVKLAHALIGVGTAAGPLARWLAQMTDRFATWIDSTVAADRASGQLQMRFQRVRGELTQLMRFLSNTGHALHQLFEDARPAGDMLYRDLTGASEAWRKMSDNTERNVRVTSDFITAARGFEGIAKLLSVIVVDVAKMGTGTGLPSVTESLTKMVPRLLTVLQQMANTFGPPLGALLLTASKLFGDLGGPEGPMVTVLNTLNAIGVAATKLLNAIGPLRGVITQALEVGLVLRFASKLGLLSLGWKRVAVSATEAAIAQNAASGGIGLGPRLGGLRGAGSWLGDFSRGGRLASVEGEGGQLSMLAEGGAIARGGRLAMLGGAGRLGLGLAGRIALPLAGISGILGALTAQRSGGFGNQLVQTAYGGINGLTGGLYGAALHGLGIQTPGQAEAEAARNRARIDSLVQEEHARRAVVAQLDAEARVRGARRGNTIAGGLNRVFRQAGGGARGFTAAQASAFDQLSRYSGSGAQNQATRLAVEQALLAGLPASMQAGAAGRVVGLEARQGRRVRVSGGRVFTGGFNELAGLRSAITLPGANTKALGAAIIASLEASGVSPRGAASDVAGFAGRGFRGVILTKEQHEAIAAAIAAIAYQKNLPKGGSSRFSLAAEAAREAAREGTSGSMYVRARRNFRAAGGRIPGVGLQDTVPIGGAMAAPGELVVNRHTERKVNYMLGGRGTLGGLVNGETTRHSALAKGGRTPSYHGFPMPHAGIASLGNVVMGQFPGLAVSSTTQGGHVNGSYHFKGEAIDLAGSPATMNRAGSWIQSHLAGQLLEGIHNNTLSVKNGKPVSNMFWGANTWNAHKNHLHLAAAGGRASNTVSQQALKVGSTHVGATFVDPLIAAKSRLFGLGGVKINTGAAAGALGAQGASTFTAPPGGAAYSKMQLRQLASSVGFPASALGTATAVAMAESHGRPNARNLNTDGSIDRGLWQINSIHGSQSTFDPVANARSALSISRGGTNWQPWVTYNTGAYRQYLAKGGRQKWGGWHKNGLDATFNSPTLIGVGEGGKPEHVKVTPHGKGGGGEGVTFHNYFTITGGDPGHVRAEIEAALEKFADQLERYYGSDVASGSTV